MEVMWPKPGIFSCRRRSCSKRCVCFYSNQNFYVPQENVNVSNEQHVCSIYIVQCKWYLWLKISVQGPFKPCLFATVCSLLFKPYVFVIIWSVVFCLSQVFRLWSVVFCLSHVLTGVGKVVCYLSADTLCRPQTLCWAEGKFWTNALIVKRQFYWWTLCVQEFKVFTQLICGFKLLTCEHSLGCTLSTGTPSANLTKHM